MLNEAEKSKRPSRISMEGMIFNANQVLEQALQPGPNSSIPQAFFKACKGVVLLSVVEVGFIWSGNLGTGILLKKLDENGTKWSAPVACGCTGMGWGALVGGSVKEIMMFIFDEATLQKIGFDKMGLRLGAQGELTLGPLGRAHTFDTVAGEQGFGTVHSVAFSKGAFVGLSVEGSIVGARKRVNQQFYGREGTSAGILDGTVELPVDKETLMDDVYEKLKSLSTGIAAPSSAPVGGSSLEAKNGDIEG